MRRMTPEESRIANEEWIALEKLFEEEGLSLAQRSLVMFGICYQNGERPLEVWKAISMCHRAKITYPKWVTDSLALIATRLLTLGYQTEKKKLPQLIFEAIGIDGNEFKDERLGTRDIALCKLVEKKTHERYGEGTKGCDKARKEAAKELGMSKRTIEGKHQEMSKLPFYKEIIKEFLD